MKSEKRVSPEEISERELSYFELQAYWGITKHMGGLKATKELAELCHISKGEYVLVIGCGVGITPCYLTKRYGCRVVGVDISERMIGRSRGRAKREGVEDRVEFRVADAQELPFEDAVFNAIICESVNAFIENRQRAINEYMRVTQRGGYVGLNECIWIKAPTPRLVEYVSHTMGAEFPASAGWQALLEGCGLRDVTVRTYKVNPIGQWINEVRQFDFNDFLRAWYSFLSMYLKSSSFRRVIKEKYLSGLSPGMFFEFFNYLGYGIYVGRQF